MTERHNSGPIDFNEEPTSHLQVPKLAADPSVKNVGDIWLNTTSHAVKVQTNSGTTTTLGSGSGVSKFSSAVGNGALTSFAITHNLGTLDVAVAIHLVSTGVMQVIGSGITSITVTDVNTVTVVAASAPATNNLRVTVIG